MHRARLPARAARPENCTKYREAAPAEPRSPVGPSESPTQAPCHGSYQAPLNKLVYNGQLFYQPSRVSKDGPPNVWKAFQGRRWVLEIGGFGGPAYTPCGFYSEVPDGLEASPEGNSYGLPASLQDGNRRFVREV